MFRQLVILSVFILASIVILTDSQSIYKYEVIVDHIEKPKRDGLIDYGTIRVKKINHTAFVVDGYFDLLLPITNEYTNSSLNENFPNDGSIDDSVDETLLENMDACFTAFDKDGDGRLSLSEFSLICRALFRNDKGHIYVVPADRIEQMFKVFDKNADGYIDREEFQFCWNCWIKTIVRPINTFLIVDVQNDFVSGSLSISNCSAQQDGLEIIEPINKLLETVDFDAVFYSLDWHPSDHVSFIDNIKQRPLDTSCSIDADSAQVYDTVVFAGEPPMKQRLWPRHCVQDSWGSELHEQLKVVDHGIKIYKGTNPEVDSYSVFWDNKKLTDTSLIAQLKMKGATDIYVCGLAYDVCVGATAIDALYAGYRTILIDDCCRGVDLNDIEKTKQTVISSNGVIVHTNEVKAMVEGRDRRPELGYKLAMELSNPNSALSQKRDNEKRMF